MERAEKCFFYFWIDSAAEIPDRNDDLLGFANIGSNLKFPQSVGNACHGLDAVHGKIDKNLLQLNPVAGNRW